jgi:hypothetical protein
LLWSNSWTKAEVIILSYVASTGRAKGVPVEIRDLIPFHHKFLGKEICWKKKLLAENRSGGEVNLAWQWGANVIFDDNASICMEAASWDMEHYPINTKWCDHQWCGGGYSSFKAAVDAYLQTHQDD